MTDDRDTIQAFLKKYSMPMEPDTITKAGVVPFIQQNGMRLYMAMKPRARHPGLGEPEFQLCKGTRMFFDGTQWQDMKFGKTSEQLESLAETALREGVEELGLVLANIETLHDVGTVNFTSATSGKPIISNMFAALLKQSDDFLPMDALAATTADRQFFTLAAFCKVGRPDHAHVLTQIDAILSQV